MAADDDLMESPDASDPSGTTPPDGRRRSTFTPPSSDAAASEYFTSADRDAYGDDALADVIAAQFNLPRAAAPAPDPDSGLGADSAPASDADASPPDYVAPPDYIAPPEADSPPQAVSASAVPDPVFDSTASDAESADPAPAADPAATAAPPADQASAAAPPGDQAPPTDWSAPADPAPFADATGVVDPAPPAGASSLQPPVRRSLDDTELAMRFGEAGASTLEQIEQLQKEIELREAEAREFETWQNQMLDLGTDEALEAIERARASFTGVVPEVPVPTEPPAFGNPPSVAEPGEASPPPPAAENAPPPLIEPPQNRAEPSMPPLVPPSEPISDLDRALLASKPAPQPGTRVDLETIHTADFGEFPVPGPSVPPPNGDSPGIPSLFVEPASPADGTGQQSEGRAGTGAIDFDRLIDPSRSAATSPASATPAVAAHGDSGAHRSGEPMLGMPAASDGVRAFEVEEAGLEPTPEQLRTGRAARLFWLWFGANGTALSVALGAVLLSLGMSLRQTVLAALAGAVLSFIPLGVSALAGKRSGMPTMVISRAVFGTAGNALPALIAFATRVFWGAAFVWLAAVTAETVLQGALLSGGLSASQVRVMAVATGFLIALVVAFFGYGLIAKLQLVLSIVAGVLVVGLIALTIDRVDLQAALTVADGPWILVAGGAVLVFSVVGLLWAQSGSDLARYQRTASSGGASMFWASAGAALPVLVLVVWGALLAASDPQVASGLITAPIATLDPMLPRWYPIPLLIAAALPLLAGAAISIYSSAFSLQALGLRVGRHNLIPIAGLVVGGLAVAMAFVVPDVAALTRDLVTTIAVPVAAWTGIFAADMMLRKREFHAPSLLRRGGVYPDVRWGNLIALVAVSAIGFGLIVGDAAWLAWQGYLLELAGIPLTGALASSDIGVLVALGLGLLVPFVAGVPSVRKQERSLDPDGARARDSS